MEKGNILFVAEMKGANAFVAPNLRSEAVHLQAGVRLRFTPPVFYRTPNGEHQLWVGTAVYTLQGQLKFFSRFWGTTEIEISQLVPGQRARVVRVPETVQAPFTAQVPA